jgi:hypothetical protein
MPPGLTKKRELALCNLFVLTHTFCSGIQGLGSHQVIIRTKVGSHVLQFKTRTKYFSV